jgi:hypothetical protein
MKVAKIVRKDIGAARPQGILLEDALSALCGMADRLVCADVKYGCQYERWVGKGIKVEWWYHSLSIPSLIVECSQNRWYEIREFLQRRGLFRSYPSKKEKKVQLRVV